MTRQAECIVWWQKMIINANCQAGVGSLRTIFSMTSYCAFLFFLLLLQWHSQKLGPQGVHLIYRHVKITWLLCIVHSSNINEEQEICFARRSSRKWKPKIDTSIITLMVESTRKGLARWSSIINMWQIFATYFPFTKKSFQNWKFNSFWSSDKWLKDWGWTSCGIRITLGFSPPEGSNHEEQLP